MSDPASSRPRIRSLLEPRKLTLLLAAGLAPMAAALVSPALPQIEDAFAHRANAEILVKLMLTMPAITSAIGAPLAGFIADRIGRKPLLLASLLLFALAGASGFVLPNLPLILAGRALLGLGMAGTMVSAMALIGDFFSGTERHHLMGVQGAFMDFGAVVLLLAGGWLAELGWRPPFLFYLIGLALVPLVLLSIHEPNRNEIPEADDADKSGSDQPNGDAEEKAPKRANPEEPQETPGGSTSIPWATLAFIDVLAIAAMILFYVVPVQLPFLIEQLEGDEGAEVGGALAVTYLVSALASWQYWRVRNSFSFPAIFIPAFGFQAAGYALFALAGGYPLLYAGLVVSGIGVGLMLPNFNLWLLDVAPRASRGRIVGSLTTCMYLGQFLSPLAVQPAVDAFGLRPAFAVTGAVLAAIAGGFLIYKLFVGRADAPGAVPAPAE